MRESLTDQMQSQRTVCWLLVSKQQMAHLLVQVRM
jgi:hypothetical protein